jgi:hypothetical protein
MSLFSTCTGGISTQRKWACSLSNCWERKHEIWQLNRTNRRKLKKHRRFQGIGLISQPNKHTDNNSRTPKKRCPKRHHFLRKTCRRKNRRFTKAHNSPNQGNQNANRKCRKPNKLSGKIRSISQKQRRPKTHKLQPNHHTKNRGLKKSTVSTPPQPHADQLIVP